MAGRPDALAVDEKAVSAPDRNAAILYAEDAYNPAKKGINGRRVAGEGFLRGFLRHADVGEFLVMPRETRDMQTVAELAAALRPGVPVRRVSPLRPLEMAPAGTLHHPSPNYAREAWRRAPFGSAAWSVCGVTHTTSTEAVLAGFFDLRVAPVADWDAVICTSEAVRRSVVAQLDLIDDYLERRFGAAPPPRFQTPVIPLGIHCEDFRRDPGARKALRARIGAGPQDVVCVTLARLTPVAKFDPLPVFIAMEAAQRRLGAGHRLHLVHCGIHADRYAERVFAEGAARLMPSVAHHVLDGAKPEERRATLSGGDIFLFLIDNIQETFGLAPVEAMAAGLPLIVSDWDGMKDTVSPDVGIRVPTRGLTAAHTAPEAFRYMTGFDNNVHFCASVSALTEIDMGGMIAAIVTLARDGGLRRKLGAAGRRRADELYDWAKIVPRIQDLWAELAARRRRGAGRQTREAPGRVPVIPSPMLIYAGYPTEAGGHGATRFAPDPEAPAGGPALALKLRNYGATGRIFADERTIRAVFGAVAGAGAAGMTAPEAAAAARTSPDMADRALIWLMKYGFLRRLG